MCEDSVKTTATGRIVAYSTDYSAVEDRILHHTHQQRLARFLARRYYESRLTGAVTILDLEEADLVMLHDWACCSLTPDELATARLEAESGLNLPGE